MGNIISYVEEYGRFTFRELPFNEVDALVLSQFSYLKLDGVIPKIPDKKEPVSFLHLAGHMDPKSVFADERYEKNNRQLFKNMLKSRRFSGAGFHFYASILDETVETQFCALTCFLEDALPVVVYRGTDENFVGWKEDFNMAFKKPVPGQYLAKWYLDQVGERISSEFMICGHSKGGNLAVYSSMNVNPQIQDKIKRIYSFDGPGFRPEMLKSEDYDKIADRIEKYIPRSSMVGLLLEEHENYIVVDSRSIGFQQHNPYNWLVKGASFVGKEKIDKRSRFMNRMLNEWILTLDEEQLEVFGETLFYILEGCEMKNMIEVAQDWKKGLNNMIRASKEVDGETRDKIYEVLRILGDIAKDTAKDDLDKRKELLKENIKSSLKRQ